MSPRDAIETATTSKHARYDAYKDASVDWLDEIPSHWEITRTDALMSSHRDTVDSDFLDDREVFHYSIPVIDETGDGQAEDGSEINSSKILLQGGELLVSKLNPRKSRVLLGEVKDLPCVCSSEFVVMVPKSCHARFAMYLYSAEHVRQYLDSTVQSATRSHQRADPTNIAKMKAAWPPLPEQRAIAAYLDRETERIDALIDKKERLIDLLEEKRTALISRAVTKGLDDDVEMKDSGVEWLGEIPAGWDLIKLRWLTDNIEQGWSPSAEDREAADDEWGVITLSAVKDGVFHPSEHKTLPKDTDPRPEYEIQPGDFLLTRANTPELVGDVCLVSETREKLMMSDLVYRLDLRPELVNSRFLTYWMLSRSGRHQVERSARGSSKSMVKVSQGHIKSWLAALPPLGEQQEIANHLDAKTSELTDLIHRIEDGIDRLKEYRTALISAAVTGQIDVRGEAEGLDNLR
jgi:type I restriction enzyme S subunit